MLFQRGRVWWYKAPNGERVSTGTAIESEAVDFKIRKLAELRSDQPHIKTPIPAGWTWPKCKTTSATSTSGTR